MGAWIGADDFLDGCTEVDGKTMSVRKIIEERAKFKQVIRDMHYIAKYSNRQQLLAATECLRSIQQEAENEMPELKEI